MWWKLWSYAQHTINSLFLLYPFGQYWTALYSPQWYAQNKYRTVWYLRSSWSKRYIERSIELLPIDSLISREFAMLIRNHFQWFCSNYPLYFWWIDVRVISFGSCGNLWIEPIKSRTTFHVYYRTLMSEYTQLNPSLFILMQWADSPINKIALMNEFLRTI